MKIGLYGLPTAGKTYILNAVNNIEALHGRDMLDQIAPDFSSLDDDGKDTARKELASSLKQKESFIMDGHYSFGDDVVFTEMDGQLYDVFLYLYVDPDILSQRMQDSIRNNKYLCYDIAKWQMQEIQGLREYCHKNNKDFYVIDNPEKGCFYDISMVLSFITSIIAGFSCVNFANKCADKIMQATSEKHISLFDGDKTITTGDTSGMIGYRTHLFDGNFYTGFQSWRHFNEFTELLRFLDDSTPNFEDLKIEYNEFVTEKINQSSFILTSGWAGTWEKIAKKFGVSFFTGNEMSAETKLFIVKKLQENGCNVVAYGDGMNDYYMLKQADESYLISKPDGSISRSLKGKDLEGISIVNGRTE